MPEKSKQDKPKFETVLTIGGKMYKLPNERKRRRSGRCNKEKKLGRK